MTIAIGMRAQNGLVVAADTEESTGDYMKGVSGKMAAFFTHDNGWAESCIIAGAGDSGYVHALMEELGETYQAADPLMHIYHLGKNTPSLQAEFRDCIKRFYKEHIIPFAGYPERKRPDVEMLIACQRKTIMHIFTSEKTVVNYASAYKAIGYGSTFAELFLGKLWGNMPIEQAEILAAYIVFLVKESVESCGKFTTLSTIRGAKVENGPDGSRLIPTTEARFVHPERIEKWEHSFKKKWWKAERDMIISMIDKELLVDSPPKQSAQRKLTGQQ
jgi:ATP-dependent protease HslVU (ClpYQ) peptidase subunit